jgi:hypothetical protein
LDFFVTIDKSGAHITHYRVPWTASYRQNTQIPDVFSDSSSML